MEMREFMKMNDDAIKFLEEQTGHNYWVGQIHAWNDAIKLLEDITDE